MSELSTLSSDVSLSPTSLTVVGELDYERWEQIVNQLMVTEAAAPWWLGDLLRYGEAAHGEKYAQAVEMTGRSVATLTNWMWVAERYPPSKRRADVSWSIHREIAPLPPEDREKWLDAAENESWTKAELRRQIRLTPTGDTPHVRPTEQRNQLPSGGNDNEIEVVTPDRMCWKIQVTVPETADIVAVDGRIRRSAEALEAVLKSLRQDPEVSVYNDTEIRD
jgi:hypothetical protein